MEISVTGPICGQTPSVTCGFKKATLSTRSSKINLYPGFLQRGLSLMDLRLRNYSLGFIEQLFDQSENTLKVVDIICEIYENAMSTIIIRSFTIQLFLRLMEFYQEYRHHL